MFLLFTNRNPILYGILLLFIVLLRLPSFHPNYFGTIESSYLIAAQRLVKGELIYRDVWELKPPLTLWLYESFIKLFGDFALTGLRLFTCFYIFIGACLTDRLISTYRTGAGTSFFPAFFYAILVSIPWHYQEMTPELLLTVPTLLSFIWLTDYSIEEQHRWGLLFGIGVMFGLSLGIKWQGGMVIISVLISYFLVARPLIRDLTTMFAGFILSVLPMFLLLYYDSVLGSFWDLTVLYNFDHFQYDSFNGRLTDRYTLVELLRVFGIFILLTLIGFLGLKGKGTATIKLRKLDTVMSVWLTTAGLTLVLSGKFFYLPYLYFGVPVMVYYITGYGTGPKSSRLKRFLLFSAYLTPTYSYLLFILCTNDNRYASLKYWERKDIWVSQIRQKLTYSELEKALRKDLLNHNVNDGILITHYQPETYLRLKKYCASPYTDFSAAYTKIDWLKHNFRNSSLFSRPESMADVYETFRKESPDYIVDPYDIFGQIKHHLPVLLETYSLKKIGYCKVYYKRTPENTRKPDG